MLNHTPHSLQQAARHFDIVRFLMKHGLSPQPSGDDDVAVNCPFCDDHKPRLGIKTVGTVGLANCFNCGWRGNLLALLTAPEIGGMSYDEAVRTILRQGAGKSVSSEPQTILEDSVTSISLPAEFRPLRSGPDIETRELERSAPFRQYLRNRGLSPALVESYGMGYARAGKYSQRVIIPITFFDTLVSFVARAIGDREPKILTPPASRTGAALFNLDRLWGREEIVLVEGIFDALVMPDQAVAVLGSSLSDQQLHSLQNSGVRRITFCFDPDKRGLKAVADIAGHLSYRFDDIRVARLPSGTDPSSVGPLALQQAIRAAEPFSAGSRIRLRRAARG